MRRIFPALIFTVILTYIAGALWCSALMFLDVAKEGTHALLWISNIQYWRESHQYFAPNSDELALLHCWSLSLEEQFYLIWPLFIVLAHRFGRTFEAIAIAAVASLVSSILVTRTDPSATFFLTPFRIYEFGCGALVLFLEARLSLGRAAAECLSAGGVIAIVASAMTFDSAMAHMDVAALLPCLGAAAVILAGSETKAAQLITRPVMLGTGRDLLFALSLPLADHLLCPLHLRRRCRHGGRHARTGGRDGRARDRHVFFRRTALHPAARGPQGEFPQERPRLLVGDPRCSPRSPMRRSSRRDSPGACRRRNPNAPICRIIRQARTCPRCPVRSESYSSATPSPPNISMASTPLMRQLNISYEAKGGAGCLILYGVTLTKPLRREECLHARDETLGVARDHEPADHLHPELASI